MSATYEMGDVARHVRWSWVIGGYVVALALAVLLAVVLQRLGGWSGGLAWERTLLLRVGSPLPPALDVVVLVLPWFGTNITLVPAIAIAAFWLIKHAKRADLAMHLLVVEAGSATLTPVLKYYFDRPRPDLWSWRGQFAFSAYPSGHAIAGVAVLFTIAILLHRELGWRWPYLVATAMLVASAYSRLYLGVHWPSDVLAGTAVGLVWLGATLVGFRPAEPHPRAGPRGP